jgi:hypothetical protein
MFCRIGHLQFKLQVLAIQQGAGRGTHPKKSAV